MYQGAKGKLTGSPGTPQKPRFTKDEAYAKAVCAEWEADERIQEAKKSKRFVLKTFKHEDDGQTFHGWLVQPKGPKLGVILIHTAVGPHDVFLRWKAEQLAAAGCTAFIADMLGDETGMGWDGPWSVDKRKVLTDDRSILRKRMQGIVKAFAEETGIPASRTCAIGYCFGGRAVLDLARLGADSGVAGVVSFHGILDDGVIPANDMSRGPKVLICHGDADPFSSVEDRVKCEEQLRNDGARWQMITFSGTRHGFTNPAQALNDQSKFCYDPRAARKSWAATEALFAEVLATSAGTDAAAA